MAKGDWEGATAVMDMDNTAHNLPVFKGITLEAILSQQNLACQATTRWTHKST